MTIVLVAPKTPSEEGKQFLLSSSGVPDQGGVEIPAHRVVLAARSEWFQRALQSGMKEAIDRRIVVQDIEESLFRIFLKYLYGKHIDLSAISQQEVVELLTVADRYEVRVQILSCLSRSHTLSLALSLVSDFVTASHVSSRVSGSC